MSIPKITDILNNAASYDGGAIVTTSYADDYILKGKTFQVQRTFEIGTETTVKFVADFSDVGATTAIFLMPLVISSSSAPCHVKTYAITSYTGGTEYPARNLNQLPGHDEARTNIKYDVTSSDTAGDDLREYELGAAGNPVQTRGGVATGTQFLMIPPGAIILLEVENYSTTAATFFNANITWFEI